MQGSYHITINTEPEQATLSLIKNETVSENANNQTITVNQTGMRNALFDFHGIGLISAGCSASFKLLKPDTLAFHDPT